MGAANLPPHFFSTPATPHFFQSSPLVRIAMLANPDSWYLRDLARAAGTKHEVVQVNFLGLAAELGGPHVTPERVFSGPHDLATFNAVLVRTMPPGSLEQVVIRMDLLARHEVAGGVVLNPPKALELAVDKYLTSAKLQQAGLLTPRTFVCQNVEEALTAFALLGGDCVVKPLFGSEGRGITRLQDEALALRAFKMLTQLGAVLYLQEFIPHEGADLRLLVIGDEVLAMRRKNDQDWRTNVSRGATCEPLPLNDSLRELAHRAAAAVGAPLAGVDLLPGKDGQLYAIEVNAVPGWQALSRTLQVDVAAKVLNLTEKLAKERGTNV